MKNSDYWKQRFFQLEYAQTAESAKTTKAVQHAYQSAHKEILNEIYSWYGRFAKNNGITMSQARQLLKADELEEFHWSVEQYIKRGKECAVNNQKWFKELENASVKFHITRLEALETNLKANLEILAAQKENLVSGAVKDAFRTSYYKSCFEVQRGFNVGFDIGKIDEDKLEKLIRKPWATDGYNFSERIWRDKNKLINIAHQEITKSVMLGGAPDKAIKSISQAMNTSEYNARRLVMTENSYFGALGEKKMYEEFEFEKYEVIAAHSAAIKTCETCAEMDGKVFLTRDLTPGLNANPFHPNCHCTTVPYFDDFNDGEMRFARGKDGKGYYIPSDMKYPEWKEKFVDVPEKPVSPAPAAANTAVTAEKALDKSAESGIIKSKALAQGKEFNLLDFDEFVDAQSVESLKKFAADKLGVSHIVGIDGLKNGSVAQRLLSEINELSNQYNKRFTRISLVDYGSHKTAAETVGNEIRLNVQYLNRPGALEAVLDEWEKSGYIPKMCNDIEYIARHEFFHLLTQEAIDAPNSQITIAVRRAIKVGCEVISENGRYNCHEFVADLLSARDLTKSQKKLKDNILNLLRRGD